MRQMQMPKLALWHLVVLVLALWLFTVFAVYGQLPEWSERGQFGDLFGSVNALFSGLAFAGLYWALRLQMEQLELQRTELKLQREELEATRHELEGQKLQLKLQTETFTLQRFEDSFFALLRTHGEIVSSMDVYVDQNRYKSRECFAVLYNNRLTHHHARYVTEPGETTLQAVQGFYTEFFEENQAVLGHYFRHLYHIVKFVKEAAPTDAARRYTSLVRAQLSAYEHVLLFYNCLSVFGYGKFKPLIEEFALLENMPQELLINADLHMPLYAQSAYGTDMVPWGAS